MEPCINGRVRSARILWRLDYLRRAGIALGDRMAEAIDRVRKKRDEHGSWPLENPYPGRCTSKVEGRAGEPSRWNTLRALRVLRWASVFRSFRLQTSDEDTSREYRGRDRSYGSSRRAQRDDAAKHQALELWEGSLKRSSRSNVDARRCSRSRGDSIAGASVPAARWPIPWPSRCP